MGKVQRSTDVLRKWGVHEVDPLSLYADLFRLGSNAIQRQWETGDHKPNPIILGSKDGRITRHILFDDTFEQTLALYQGYDWAITNGLAYWGKANTSDAQGAMYGMIFDLDGVKPNELENFLLGAIDGGHYPVPTYVVLSGHGLHLYYVFEEPLQLYPNTKMQLKNLKYALTDKMWNKNTSCLASKQFQGINQGFRIVGGPTKIRGRKVRAFSTGRGRVTVDYLNSFVSEDNRVDLATVAKESRYTLEEARIKFPEWYDRVIVRGEPSTGAGRWYVNESLFYWWVRKIKEEGVCGHRYFCVMCMAIYAAKCGISKEKCLEVFEKHDLLRHFNTIEHNHPFTQDDVESAFECLDDRYVTFPRKDIERLSGIPIPPNKRNGRKREQHLAILHAMNNAKRSLGEQIGGKPSKRELVESYFLDNQKASIRKAASDLGISKSTVQKWRPKDGV